MNSQTIVITGNDRRRLGTMLDRAYAAAADPREYLHRFEAALEQAVAVDQSEVPQDVVTMNSTVEILDLETEEREVYTLVYPERADASHGRISVLAPIGRAMLGRSAGEVVPVEVPSGRRWIKIEAVRFQPERSGQDEL